MAEAEILESGGDATIVDAQLVDGISDVDAEALFRTARDADYDSVAGDARTLNRQTRGKLVAEKRAALEADVVRLERRVAEIVAVDFFGASGRERATAALRVLRERLDPAQGTSNHALKRESYQGRVWVTRAGIHVDRIASAWLIRRFIDAAATFKFVPSKGYVPEPNELRFDMFEAEFSHEGELCTFEVLCQRMALKEPGLPAIAEVVHDIDLKDAKFGRPETEGVAAQIAGIALLYRDDDARLAHGAELCEQLLAYYSRKRDDKGPSARAPTKRASQ